MWQSLQSLCPALNSTLPQANLMTIQQPSTHNRQSDILLVSYLIHLLESSQNCKIMFFGVRQNYAHYLALSKKLGKSLEQYLKKNENFQYYECFMNSYCQELPLGDSSPAGYVPPPKSVTSLKKYDEIPQQICNYATKDTYIFLDCLAFIEHKPAICYEIYESAVINGTKQLVIGGCTPHSLICKLLNTYGQLLIKIQNDVGGYGRVTVVSRNNEGSYLWKWQAGKIQVEAYMKV